MIVYNYSIKNSLSFKQGGKTSDNSSVSDADLKTMEDLTAESIQYRRKKQYGVHVVAGQRQVYVAVQNNAVEFVHNSDDAMANILETTFKAIRNAWKQFMKNQIIKEVFRIRNIVIMAVAIWGVSAFWNNRTNTRTQENHSEILYSNNAKNSQKTNCVQNDIYPTLTKSEINQRKMTLRFPDSTYFITPDGKIFSPEKKALPQVFRYKDGTYAIHLDEFKMYRVNPETMREYPNEFKAEGVRYCYDFSTCMNINDIPDEVANSLKKTAKQATELDEELHKYMGQYYIELFDKNSKLRDAYLCIGKDELIPMRLYPAPGTCNDFMKQLEEVAKNSAQKIRR